VGFVCKAHPPLDSFCGGRQNCRTADHYEVIYLRRIYDICGIVEINYSIISPLSRFRSDVVGIVAFKMRGQAPVYSSYTVVLAGNAGTGKTSLITRMSKGVFAEPPKRPIAGLMTPATVAVDGRRVRLMLWDTSGDADYRDMTTCHLANAQAAVFVFGVDDQASFDGVFSVWTAALQDNSKVPHITFLVGNKIDLPEAERVVRVEEATKALPLPLHYVSCVDGTGVADLTAEIAGQLVEAFPKITEDALPLHKKREAEHEYAVAEGGCECLIL
jgi:small GTP-binding protein